MKRNLFAAFLICTAVAARGQSSAPAKTRPSPPAKTSPAVKVTEVEGITEYRLANGLQVLLFPDPTKPTVTVNVTYKVGSRQENYGETGMAHLLEHLMFKGCTRHRNIPQELTAHGARPNGSTSYDRTNYFEIFQASEENLRWALDLESDRMVHSFISKKDLDSEMTVVRNEFEAGENDPEGILTERVLSTAYLWHAYGRSPIGARSDIERVPIERLQAFYRTYYQPDNAVLLVAGRFDEKRTLAAIESVFGTIPKPRRILPEPYTEEPTQDGERSVTLRRVGDVQALAVAYHVPSGSHPDAAPLQLLAEILAATPSGRLYKALVESHKASSVSDYFPLLHDPGFLMFQAEVRQENSLAEAEKSTRETIEAILKSPTAKEELDRARAQLLKDIDLTLNSSQRVGLELSEWIGDGDWRLFFLNRDRIRSATLEDVQRVAAAYLKPSNATVGEFYPTPKPDRAEIPPRPDVAAELKGYKGDAAVAAGEAFDVAPAAIESRVVRFDLPAGMKVALLPKKTRGQTIVAAMTFHFGDEKSLRGTAATADLAGDMLLRGTHRLTRQQIKDELDRLKARVAVTGRPTQAAVSIETLRENFPAVLKLVAEVLKDPSFPASELDQLKQENLAQIEQERTDPESIGETTFERHLNPYPKGEVWYVPTPDEAMEDYKSATLDGVKKFYSNFYGASRAELAIVGDFDPAPIRALTSELFGDWKSATPFERVPRRYHDVPAAKESLETPDKANAFFVAGMNLALRDDDADYPALVMGNYMLGGGFLNSRLAVRIRQKEGLSYGVGSQIQASPLDQSGSFTSFAIFAPQNKAKLEVAFQEEVARVLKDGFTAEELKQAKSGYLQSRQVTRAQDGSLARTLAQDLFLGRTLAWDAAFEKKIGELNADEIRTAMAKRIDPSKLTIVEAGDFAKAAAPPAK
ncbi:MAG TPA: pitrilysin family protein [Thermoanaerobaculia bacterium]